MGLLSPLVSRSSVATSAVRLLSFLCLRGLLPIFIGQLRARFEGSGGRVIFHDGFKQPSATVCRYALPSPQKQEFQGFELSLDSCVIVLRNEFSGLRSVHAMPNQTTLERTYLLNFYR